MSLLARVDEGRAQPEHVEAELSHRPVAARRLHAEVLTWDLPHGALGGGQHGVEPLASSAGVNGSRSAVGTPTSSASAFGIPAVDGAVADDGRGHARNAEGLEVTPSFGLGLDVEPLELHSP